MRIFFARDRQQERVATSRFTVAFPAPCSSLACWNLKTDSTVISDSRMFFPKWLNMLWMLERYRDRVFSCDTDLRNSSAQVPRRGDFDLGRFHRSSKTCAVRTARSFLANFLFGEPEL